MKSPSYLLQSLVGPIMRLYAGHDGIQLAVGQVFTKGEDFFSILSRYADRAFGRHE